MDMLRRAIPLEDIDTGLLALFPDDGTDPFRHFTTSYLMAILGDPDNMKIDGKCRMGALARVTHAPQSTQNLLKLPPKQSVRFYAAMSSGLRLIS
jgi:hypothetical protein